MATDGISLGGSAGSTARNRKSKHEPVAPEADTQIVEENGEKYVGEDRYCAKKPENVKETAGGDWFFDRTTADTGFVHGWQRLAIYGPKPSFTEVYQPGTRVRVPFADTNNLHDGGWIRNEAPKVINSENHYRLEWERFPESSKTPNLKDYFPVWIPGSRIIKHTPGGREIKWRVTHKPNAPPVVSSGGRRVNVATTNQWTWEEMKRMHLRRDTFFYDEADNGQGMKSYMLLARDGIDHMLWGVEINAHGAEMTPWCDAICVVAERVLEKNSMSDAIRNGFRQILDDRERARVADVRREKIRIQAEKHAEWEKEMKAQKIAMAAGEKDENEEGKEEEEEKEEEDKDEAEVDDEEVEETGAQEVDEEMLNAEKENEKGADGLLSPVRSEDLGPDADPSELFHAEQFGAVKDDDELRKEARQALMRNIHKEFELSRPACQDPGVFMLIRSLLETRAELAESELESSEWKIQAKAGRASLKQLTEESQQILYELGKKCDELTNSIGAVREVGRGFLSIVKTESTLLRDTVTGAAKLDLLIGRMAEKLQLELNTQETPDALLEGIFDGLRHFAEAFGPTGSFRVVPRTGSNVTVSALPAGTTSAADSPGDVGLTAANADLMSPSHSPLGSPLRALEQLEAPAQMPDNVMASPPKEVTYVIKSRPEPGTGVIKQIEPEPTNDTPWPEVELLTNPFLQTQKALNYYNRFVNKMKLAGMLVTENDKAGIMHTYYTRPTLDIEWETQVLLDFYVKLGRESLTSEQKADMPNVSRAMKLWERLIREKEVQQVTPVLRKSPPATMTPTGVALSEATKKDLQSLAAAYNPNPQKAAGTGAKRTLQLPTTSKKLKKPRTLGVKDPKLSLPYDRQVPAPKYKKDAGRWDNLFTPEELAVVHKEVKAKKKTNDIAEWMKLGCNELMPLVVIKKKCPNYIVTYDDLKWSLFHLLRQALKVNKQEGTNWESLKTLSKTIPWFWAAFKAFLNEIKEEKSLPLEIAGETLLTVIGHVKVRAGIWKSRPITGQKMDKKLKKHSQEVDDVVLSGEDEHESDSEVDMA